MGMFVRSWHTFIISEGEIPRSSVLPLSRDRMTLIFSLSSIMSVLCRCISGIQSIGKGQY
jgi:hypothetical protein